MKGIKIYRYYILIIIIFLNFTALSGTSGRTRTDTLLKAMDFESIVSTNFTTLAYLWLLYQ